MHEEVGRADQLVALAEDDARPIRRWLTRQLCAPTGPLAEADFGLLDRIAVWSAEENDPNLHGQILTTLDRMLTAATRVPDAAPLLVLYLKYLCDQAWERAWDVAPILDTMRYAARTWTGIVATGTAVDAELTTLTVRMLDLLDSEMATFNAGTCGTLAAWARSAAATAARAEEVVAAAARGKPSPIAEAVAAEAHGDHVYYAALARASQAVHDHFAVGGSDLVGAATALRAAEEFFPDGIPRSELRAHRYSVEALIEVADQPWLLLDQARFVYLYPFGLYEDLRQVPAGAAPDRAAPDSVGPDEDSAAFAVRMVEVARRTADRWRIAGWDIATHPDALVAAELPLDDVWKGSDPLGRQYRGMAVTLPDVELVDPDRPDHDPITFSVQVRLSELGNHYLRLECELSEVTPQQVYAAMARVAPEFGDLVHLGTPLRPADADADDTESENVWPRLADFATELTGDVSVELARHSGRQVRHSSRPGMYHVLVSVDRATLVAADGSRTPVTDAVDTAKAVGAQPLCHPVRHGLSALAEWLRYPVDVPALPVVDVPGLAGDLLLRTCNSTLMVIPASPEYTVNTVQEAAEFVAALEGMFAGWQDQIAEYYDHLQVQLATMIVRLERGGTAPDPANLRSAEYERVTQELVEMQGALEAQHLRLHRFVMASRLSLMFVTSPSLMTSPVARLIIDRLLAAAKFDTLRGEFEGMIDKVLGDRIGDLVDASVRRQQERNDALARAVREEQTRLAQIERERLAQEERDRVLREKEAAARQERRDRANQRRNDALLGGIAAVGLSGLMQIVQAGYDLRQLAAMALVMTVLLTAGVVGWILHRLHPDSVVRVLEKRQRRRAPMGGSVTEGNAK
ncbi:hypothetical protein ACWDV4_10420 [Micromonospora sp. NPDC003197]